MRTRYLVGMVVVVAVFLAVGARVMQQDGGVSVETPVPHYQADTVKVRITEEAQVSRGQQPYLVQLESGVIPPEVTHLRVLTDENCQPDADGVSHCLNRVAFTTADGEGEAVFRHRHKMSEEPCLTPEQTVELVA